MAELVTPDGTWEWHSFEHFLPNNLFLLIAAIKPPSVINGDDQIFWVHLNLGKFAAKFAYCSLSNRILIVRMLYGIVFGNGRASSCKCVLVDDYAWKTQDQEGILQKTHSKQ